MGRNDVLFGLAAGPHGHTAALFCGLCVLNLTVQGSARAKIGVFELTVVAQEPFGPNFRAEEKGSVYLSPIFTGGSFFVTARDRFGNLAACGKALTVDIRWFCSVVLSPFCSRSLIVLRRWPCLVQT